MARHTCSAISQVALSKEEFRLPNSHSLFSQISALLTDNFSNLESSQWIPLCEQGLNVVYQLSEQPNKFSELLLRSLTTLLPRVGGENDMHVLCTSV